LAGEDFDIEKQQLLRRRLYDYEKMQKTGICLIDTTVTTSRVADAIEASHMVKSSSAVEQNP
jgi:hypothetical protein